jgi:hypothetical protein
VGDYEYLLGKDERFLIDNRVVELTPLLEIADSCYALAIDSERQKFFNSDQYSRKRAETVNMLVRNEWESNQPDNDWIICDRNYSHWVDSVTGMHLEFHPFDPFTGGVARPANTQASRARYRQRSCRSADGIRMATYNGTIVPDLSDVSLQALWQIVNGQMRIVVYKPTDASKGKFCVEIPLLGNRREQVELKYQAVQEDANLIPALFDEESLAPSKNAEKNDHQSN